MVSVTDPKVHMGTITGAEARALYATKPIVFLPMGSHEDQGPHAAMGDYILADAIAERAAVRASRNGTRTVVAPVLPYGGADYFDAMPGGITLSQDTLTRVLTDMLGCLHRHGLTRIVFINGHGGNVGPIAEVSRAIYRKTGIVTPSLYLWRIAYGILPEIVGKEKAAAVAGHGADPLTSIGMHINPGMMTLGDIPEARPLKRDPVLDLPFTALGAASFEGHEVGMPNEYDETYWAGVGKGDPRLSSAETGAALTERLTDICARFAAHYAARTK